MAAIGLVPELTVEAARLAALGAGARLLGAFGYKLGPAEVARLEAMRPDLILLAGGTDGGNEEVIRANGALLAKAALDAPIIVAGNKCVSGQVGEMLRAAGREAVVVSNVLPELGTVDDRARPGRDQAAFPGPHHPGQRPRRGRADHRRHRRCRRRPRRCGPRNSWPKGRAAVPAGVICW